MDPLTEDFTRPEDLTLLAENMPEDNIDSDEVENLQHSFLEVVQDENVQPKMQCLMMDSSFSMVTVQGEDSGIEWETTPSRCSTPWLSETANLSADVCTAMGPASSGTSPAGKIIFVMDEELISKQKKTKEKAQGAKGKKDKGIILGSLDNISGRPELVGFSQPNVKPDIEEFEEEVVDPYQEKDQKLFRLVSEGSEILNIIAPSKVVTVDEEESKEMLDNLSYLEASTVIKAHEEIQEQITDLQGFPESENPLAAPPPQDVPSLDPPGAPVSKPSIREQPNVDYFEAFTLIDAQAPGGPAVSDQEQSKEESVKALETESLGHLKSTSNNTTRVLEDENTEKVSLAEITSELLDDVFYGCTDSYSKTSDRAADGKNIPHRLSSKSTGSTLFGSQEDILTPIYLPEGPPKIIDPILLEEPKAMAFLYTDLYEEATGSRKKEEDTESISSEKSFHSRHSDREARGYLEKYVLIDETPVLEAEQNEKVRCPKDSPRIITQDLYDFCDIMSKPDTNPLPDYEEVTDFFRSSASSSPCGLEPLSRLAEVDEAQKTTKAKTKKTVLIVSEKVTECAADSLSESPLHDFDWESTFEDTTSMLEENTVPQHPLELHTDTQLPVAPLRKKPSPKSCLDLAPLTPVNTQEEMEMCAKEERAEEKETADEQEKEETSESLTEAPVPLDTPPSDDTIHTTPAENEPETQVTQSESSDEGNMTPSEKNESLEPIEPEEVEQMPTESTNNDTCVDPSKGKGQCIIL